MQSTPTTTSPPSLPPRRFPKANRHFATEKEFAKLSADWPITRFVDVWNAFAGVVPFDTLKPVKKFTDRKTAVGRIWKAIQALTPAPAPQAAPVAPKKAKATKDATAKDATPTARDGSKKANVLDLIKRPDGATLKDIMAATGWQAHSVRGFISGSLGKKMGLKSNPSNAPTASAPTSIGAITRTALKRAAGFTRRRRFCSSDSSAMAASLSWTSCSRSWHSPERT